MSIKGYKIFTHHFCSPIQGGKAIWDGTVPFDLPEVPLDETAARCGEGWNFVADIATGFQYTGMWPTGRPVVVAAVSTEHAIQREDKMRAANLRIERLATKEEIEDAIRQLSKPFGDLAEEMVSEQIAWWEALGRPERNEDAVRAGLKQALQAQGLDLTLKKYLPPYTGWASGVVWDTWKPPHSWEGWAAWAQLRRWDVEYPWRPRERWFLQGEFPGWDTWAGRVAQSELIQCYAHGKFPKTLPNLLTPGLREAFRAGLQFAMLSAPGELGYVMDE